MAKLVLGITGGMGAGKSTLARRMSERYGWSVFSVDEERRKIPRLEGEGFERFWARARPAVLEYLSQAVSIEKGVLVVEWARWVEDGLADFADHVLVLDCPQDQRIQRLAGGDLSPKEVLARMSAQPDAAEHALALSALGKKHTVIDAREPMHDSKFEELCDELSGAEFSSSSSFCLFRIPRKGGRVIWEITNSCNYGCKYCIFSSTPRKPEGELDTARALSVLDELAEHGFTHVKFTGGEPFLRPDLLEILRHAKLRGLKSDVSTNAAFIGVDEARAIAELDLEMVHVSLDGHAKAIQEAARGARTYDPTVAGLKALVVSGVKTRVGCALFKGNENHMEELVNFCAQLGCGEVIFSLMEPAGRMRGKTGMLCARPVDSLKAEVQELSRRYAGRIKVSGIFSQTAASGCGSCPGGERFLFIDHKGMASPCTWVSERAASFAGDVSLSKQSLKQALSGGKIVLFKKIASGLGASGLGACPMKELGAFEDAAAFSKLFEGDLSANLASGGRFSELSPMYAFSNENISGTFGSMELKGKKVLAVGGSGDHMICAHAAGASEVKCFDINRLARSMASLKWRMLQKLGRQEFLNFFCYFDKGVYERFKEGLDFPARSFFDQAYAHFCGDGKAMSKSALFRPVQGIERIQKNVPYLASDQAYLLAQAACAGKEFVWSEMSAIQQAASSAVAGEKFGVALLSNMSDYASALCLGADGGDYLKAFASQVALPLALLLDAGGQAMVGYVFDGLDLRNSSQRSLVNIKERRWVAFGSQEGFEYRESFFPSAWEDGNMDIAMVWEAKR